MASLRSPTGCDILATMIGTIAGGIAVTIVTPAIPTMNSDEFLEDR